MLNIIKKTKILNIKMYKYKTIKYCEYKIFTKY